MNQVNSENGSNSSNGGGSGNNSDNSALVSLGNTSFGFNFDSEEGGSNSDRNSDRNSNNSEEGDSDGSNQGGNGKLKAGEAAKVAKSESSSDRTSKLNAGTSSHSDAAARAVAGLESIANESSAKETSGDGERSLKRKAQDSADDDNGVFYRDTETSGTATHRALDELQTEPVASSEASSQKGGRKKKKVGDMKREERNAREKERSFRISRQINELQNLLSTGGVIVPKGTKSSVLTEAANYIRMLQQHQYRSEIDRHQLVQQIQMIGGGALGQPAANTVRHVAAQNGVWSLGNFGGMPPKSAMMYQPEMNAVGDASGDANMQQQQVAPDGNVLPNTIIEPDYRFVFNSCTVGMAIASMGGAFIDCNKLFCQLSSYTKQEVCSMTIFNLTTREDLQHAFDLISQMLSAPTDPSGNSSCSSCVLRGSMKYRTDLGLSVTLIKGDDAVAKCFCVTLVKNHGYPFDHARPVPATADSLQSVRGLQVAKGSETSLDPTPRYTTG